MGGHPSSSPLSSPPHPEREADALLKNSALRRLSRFWLEALMVLTILALGSILLVRERSGSAIAVLTRDVPRGATISEDDLALAALPRSEGTFVTRKSARGLIAGNDLPRGSVLRERDLAPPPPDPGEFALPLHAFLGPQPPKIGSIVTLVVIRKEAAPTVERVRLLALDPSKDSASIVVSASEAAALRITNPLAVEIHVMRP